MQNIALLAQLIPFLLSLVIQQSSALTCGPRTEVPGAGSPNAYLFLMDLAATYKLNRSIAVGKEVIVDEKQVNAGYGISRLLGQQPGEPYALWCNGESFFSNDKNPDPANILMIPILQEPVVPIYNLPGLKATLNLTAPIWIDIYLGRIRYWNDTRLKAINPNSDLPDEEIITVARYDSGAAHTRIVTSYFSKSSDEWNTRYGEFIASNLSKNDVSQNWPPGLKLLANKVFGMQDLGLTQPYMIGYGALNDAAPFGITYANLLHKKTNQFVTCNFETLATAVNYFIAQNPNSTTFRMLDAEAPNAWPVTTFHYMAISLTTMQNYTCCQQLELVGFLDYVLFMNNQEVARRNWFNAIDGALSLRVAKDVLSKVVCDGENMYDEFRRTLIPPKTLKPYEQGLIAAAIVIFIIIVIFTIFIWRRTMLMNERHWLISSKSLDLESFVAGQSLSSMHSSTSPKQPTSTSSKDQISQGFHGSLQFSVARSTLDDKAVLLLELEAKLPKHWRKDTKLQLFRFCQRLAHASVIHFYGVSVIGSRVFAVQEFLSKGTLHYAIGNSRFDFTETIKVSMAGDIADGIAYLHSRGIVHGLLNSLSCYVSSSWTIKIADWMVNAISMRECPSFIDFLFKFDKEDMKNDKTLIPLIYLHAQAKKSGRFTQQSDVFSFGMMLVELLNRDIPYRYETDDRKTTFYQILKNKSELQMVTMPEINTTQTSTTLEKLAKLCISEKCSNMTAVLNELQTEQFHGSITDILMETMEGMINDIEKKTAELNKVSVKMRELLNQVLPASIAEKLSKGQTVEPEYFDCVSIFFSDIVGFTTISATSSPLEVMAFLNDLWIAFDSVIEQHDCYKADTISDSYMVCSGLPNRNGVHHIKHIVELSLSLLRKASTFVIRHMPGEPLRIRVGINSGPATAGVVGTKMPQYCVFGDTVNTANRMESTSQAGRVQLSDTSARLLSANFPLYKLERRGEIDVKGKGLMTTYWVDESLLRERGLRQTTMPSVESLAK